MEDAPFRGRRQVTRVGGRVHYRWRCQINGLRHLAVTSSDSGGAFAAFDAGGDCGRGAVFRWDRQNTPVTTAKPLLARFAQSALQGGGDAGPMQRYRQSRHIRRRGRMSGAAALQPAIAIRHGSRPSVSSEIGLGRIATRDRGTRSTKCVFWVGSAPESQRAQGNTLIPSRQNSLFQSDNLSAPPWASHLRGLTGHVGEWPEICFARLVELYEASQSRSIVVPVMRWNASR
jgi:hypothetical protein